MLKKTHLLSFMFLLYSLVGYSQTHSRITLNLNSVSLKVLFTEIEKQSDYTFVYKASDINDSQKISFKATNEAITSVIVKLASQLGVSHQITGKQVILKRESDKNVNLKGQVVDENGEPIIGASIKLEKGSVGVITDMGGNFSLSAPGNGKIIVTFMGYKSETVAIANRRFLKVTLSEDSKQLDEVVVVGYGSQKRVNLTGAVESLDIKSTKTRAYTNAESMLQGQVAGAFISQTSGQPGNDGATIRIRGIGTFNNNDPLVIIDGMEGDLKSINPKDIETISVLKDAASCAIYGNRAANGVILITTHGGENNKMSIEYNGLYGVQHTTSLPDVLKGLDYLELKAETYKNSNNGNEPSWYTDQYMNNYRNHADEFMYPTNYSWLDETFRAAQMTDHYISISGGGKNLKYSTSAGYLFQDGIVKGNQAKKFTFRSNVSANFLNNKLRVNANVSTYQRTVNDLPDGMEAAIYSAYVTAPTTWLYIPGIGYNASGYAFAKYNEGGFNRKKTTPVNLNASISLDPLPGLNLNVSGSMNRENYEQKIFQPGIELFGLNEDGSLSAGQPNTSSLSLTNSESTSYTFNAYGSYSRTIAKKHNLAIMAGYEVREYSYNWHWMERKNLSVNLPEFGMGDPNTQKNSSNANELAWMSFFGRFNYSFNDRYLFEFNLRNDGSSRFIKKWGLFPSTSMAWRISQEGFMKSVKWVDNLKFRFSWGRLGNESIGQSYAASDELSLGENINLNNTLVGAAAITKLANKKTTWETTEQYNFGLEFDLFKNKLSGTLEYYIKNTSDILMQVPVSATLGMSTVPYQNSGKMQNKGLELMLRYNEQIGQVHASINGSVSYVKNKIKSLAGKDEIVYKTTIWRVGEPFNSFYGLQTEGIYQSQNEINNHLIFNQNGTSVNPYMGMTPLPGDIRFKDQLTVDTNGDGKPDARDGIINGSDKTILGQSFPNWTFSTTLTAEWKGFDIALFFQGVAGIRSLNQGMITFPFHGGEANTGAWYKNSWRPDSPSKTIQRLCSDPGRWEITSQYYLEDASYLRLKNLDLGYTLPKSISNHLGAGSVIRFYVSLQNLFTITNMRYGFDPEKPAATTNTLQYPQTKIYSLGVNIKL